MMLMDYVHKFMYPQKQNRWKNFFWHKSLFFSRSFLFLFKVFLIPYDLLFWNIGELEASTAHENFPLFLFCCPKNKSTFYAITRTRVFLEPSQKKRVKSMPSTMACHVYKLSVNINGYCCTTFYVCLIFPFPLQWDE